MTHPDNATLEGRPGSAPRIPLVDMVRGAAVLAMIAYHGAWDLSTLMLADLDVTGSRAWAIFARAIAATFLFLAGLGLALAHGKGIRWRAYGKRLGVIAAAAAVITLGTMIAFPASYIFVGILHNMVLSGLIAIPFLLLPRIVAAVAALVFLAMPGLVAGGVFDQPWLAFLGLGRIPPVTNDWVPIFPWTGYVLAGIGVAPLLVPLLPRSDGGGVGRGLAAIGRYSLLIYLLHQPLMFGVLAGVRQLTGPSASAGSTVFLRDCTRLFRDSGHAEDVTRATCRCTLGELKRDGIWDAIRSGSPSTEYAQRAGNRAAECLKQSER
jgi:uncharacterized membrane protein